MAWERGGATESQAGKGRNGTGLELRHSIDARERLLQDLEKCIFIHNISMDMNSSKFLETVEDRGAWGAAVHGVIESDTT